MRAYARQIGAEVGAHALRATAATNPLDHEADIAKMQEWLGHANIATSRIYDHRRTRPKYSRGSKSLIKVPSLRLMVHSKEAQSSPCPKRSACPNTMTYSARR